MAKHSFISERQAAEKMGYNPRYFRELVKKGTLNISFTKSPTGRKYQYDEKQIDSIKNQNAKIFY